MAQSNSDIQVINYTKDLEIEIIEQSVEDDELEVIKSSPQNVKQSEAEIKVKEDPDLTDVPSVINVEAEELLNASRGKVQFEDVDEDSSLPCAKRAKVVKSNEDSHNYQQNARVNIEPVVGWNPAAPVTSRSALLTIKSEPVSEDEQWRMVKLEPPQSPPSAAGLGSCAGGDGELGAMRQLLATLQRPVDDDEVFGAHVASELRALRLPNLKRKLKRLIQEAILTIAREDDLRG